MTNSLVLPAFWCLSLMACGQQPGGSVSEVGADVDGDISTIPIPDTGSQTGADAQVDIGRDADTEDGSGQGGDGLGELCTSTADCTGELTCVFPDPGAPSGVCTTDCAEDADCPGGWRCYTLTGSGSDADRQCLPADLCIDADGDLYGWGGGCRGRDCDDTSALINPAADESCNGLDDDCDERIDDNAVEDRTECDTGFVGACAAGRNTCMNGVLTCEADGPLADETCDGDDNDCDGLVDEGDVCAGEPCCYGETCVGICGAASTAADGSCAPPEAWGDEVCDGLDNDCNGSVDDDIATVGDDCEAVAQGVCAAGSLVCNGSAIVCQPGAPSIEVCDAADNNCDGVADEDGVCGGEPCCFGDLCVGVCGIAILGEDGTCAEPATFGDEICDGLDNDCDGAVDEVFPEAGTTCGTGSPGVCFSGTTVCTDGALQCAPDLASSAEVCDGLDNDCDGVVDQEDTCSGESCCFADTCEGVCALARLDDAGVCVEPLLFGDDVCDGLDNDCDGTEDEADPRVGVACDSGLPGVCAAGNGSCDAGRYRCVAATLGSAEVCDGLDNDCDGVADDGARLTFYRDADGDGYGAAASGTVQSCEAPAGYVANATDCRDDDRLIFPGAEEVVGDGVDQSCDNQEICFVDADNDGYRLTTTIVSADADCGDSGEALAAESAGDCNDANSLVNPGRSELCNDIDDNCAGGIDEGGVCAGEACCFDDTCVGVCGAARVGADGRCAAPAAFGSEVCDGVDNDCDGSLDESDPAIGTACSSGELGACSAGTRACAAGTLVCNATRDPVAETCDGVDNDCDGTIDDGVLTTYFRDADGDTFGSAGSGTIQACSAPAGYVTSNTDCNDGSASIFPGASEIPGDEVDQSCDGTEICFVDADNDGFRVTTTVASTNVSCNDSGEARGSETAGDCDDSNSAVYPGRSEVCNGLDDNCAGGVDEGVRSPFYRDADGDTFGSAASGTTQACSAPSGFVSNNTDCNDGSASIRPGGTETCNGADDDCDGSTDEGVQSTFFRDADGDTFGSAASGSTQACSAPSGFVSNNTDCNDGSASIRPGGTETCNGADDDCDGSTDEGVQSTFFRDVDGDSFGSAGSGTTQACSAPSGFVSNNSDCNDGNSAVNPGRSEVCNGIDDNCAGGVDEGVQSTFFRDLDGDSFGSSASGTTQACTAPSGFSVSNSDCNDSNGAVYPGAPEVPGDEVDQSCDGGEICFVDADNDGYRITSTIGSSNTSCGDSGEARSSEPAGDCNDSNANINPGRTEICNGVDDDCDGSIDEGVLLTFYRDLDGDNFGAAAGGTTTGCTPPSGFAASSNDCADANASINPGAAELCNGIDDNCDTLIDNGAPSTGEWDGSCDNIDDDCDGSVDEDYIPQIGVCCLSCFGCGPGGCGQSFYRPTDVQLNCVNGEVTCESLPGGTCNNLLFCEII